MHKCLNKNIEKKTIYNTHSEQKCLKNLTKAYLGTPKIDLKNGKSIEVSIRCGQLNMMMRPIVFLYFLNEYGTIRDLLWDMDNNHEACLVPHPLYILLLTKQLLAGMGCFQLADQSKRPGKSRCQLAQSVVSFREETHENVDQK